MGVRATLPLALAILAPAVALAGVVNSLEDVVRTVREANRLQRTDSELAKSLRKLNLNVKLDNRTAEELESEMSGPRSIAELENLREITRDMPLPAVLPWFASPLPPNADELRAIFGVVLRKTLVYTANLPDFI